MSKLHLAQVSIFFISTVSLFAHAEETQLLNGVRIEHISIYQGDCIRMVDQGVDATSDCSPLVAIMYLADNRIAINVEDVNHKATMYYSVPPIKSGTGPVHHFPVKELATGAGPVEVKGACESGDFYKVRSLACSVESVDGVWSFEYQNLTPISAEK